MSETTPEPQTGNPGAGNEPTPTDPPAAPPAAPPADLPDDRPGGGDTGAANTAAQQPKRSLEDLLADMPDENRKAVLDQVGKARNEAKSLRERLREAEPKLAEYDKILESQKTAEQKANEKATAAEQRVQKLVERAAKAEVRALASKSFADPDDAAAFLDLGSYLDTESGELNTDAIEKDLADLLQRKPHLARGEDSSPRRPAPDRSQASSANGKTSRAPEDVFANFLAQKLGR